MFKNLLALLFVLMLTSCVSSGNLFYQTVDPRKEIPSTTGNLDHSSWDRLLSKYVNEKGLVDYNGFKEDRDKLDAYLTYLGEHAPTKSTSINEQFAYYINIYNAATVQIILENNQPASIKDIGSTLSPVWIESFIKIQDKTYSLADIEKGVLQKMGDPRIHFAINCASFSCPKLQNKAYTASNVNELMNAATKEFINSDRNDLTDVNAPKLSSIFKWYEKDFVDAGVSVVEFINTYIDKKIPTGARISYLDYDWSLNKQ